MRLAESLTVEGLFLWRPTPVVPKPNFSASGTVLSIQPDLDKLRHPEVPRFHQRDEGAGAG